MQIIAKEVLKKCVTIKGEIIYRHTNCSVSIPKEVEYRIINQIVRNI